MLQGKSTHRERSLFQKQTAKHYAVRLLANGSDIPWQITSRPCPLFAFLLTASLHSVYTCYTQHVTHIIVPFFLSLRFNSSHRFIGNLILPHPRLLAA